MDPSVQVSRKIAKFLSLPQQRFARETLNQMELWSKLEPHFFPTERQGTRNKQRCREKKTCRSSCTSFLQQTCPGISLLHHCLCRRKQTAICISLWSRHHPSNSSFIFGPLFQVTFARRREGGIEHGICARAYWFLLWLVLPHLNTRQTSNSLRQKRLF